MHTIELMNARAQELRDEGRVANAGRDARPASLRARRRLTHPRRSR